ncbi:retrovirus-related pol polyprotein from transposon TNT 1-94 [Tanacetum coccineum]
MDTNLRGTVTVAGARETVGSQVVQQTGIQCFNCKEFGHFAKECRKPKRVKDYTYHKKKMLLCKQAEKGVPLHAVLADWLEGTTNEEIEATELEAHYSYMAKIQEVPTADSETDTEPLEHVQNDAKYNVFANVRQHFEQPKSTSNTCLVKKYDSNATPDSPDMCDNDIQTDQNGEDERAALANLIANLKLDVDENKKIQKSIKRKHASLTHDEECKYLLLETVELLGESNSIRDSCLIALQNKQTELERYKTLNDRIVDYDKLENKLNETLGLLAQKEIDIKEGLKLKAYEISVVKEKTKLSKQIESVSKEVYTELLRSFAKLEKHSISLELALQQCQEQMKNNTICKEKVSNVFLKEREQYSEIQDLKAQLQDKNIATSELKKLVEKCKGKSVETKFDKPSVVRQPNAQRIPKPSVLGKPDPFSDSLERKKISQTKSVPKTNVSESLSKPVTT